MTMIGTLFVTICDHIDQVPTLSFSAFVKTDVRTKKHEETFEILETDFESESTSELVIGQTQSTKRRTGKPYKQVNIFENLEKALKCINGEYLGYCSL
jgi:hypothetical protein